MKNTETIFFDLDKPSQVIHNNSGSGKSFYYFFIKYSLINISEEEDMQNELIRISNDLTTPEKDREFAKMLINDTNENSKEL